MFQFLGYSRVSHLDMRTIFGHFLTFSLESSITYIYTYIQLLIFNTYIFRSLVFKPIAAEEMLLIAR